MTSESPPGRRRYRVIRNPAAGAKKGIATNAVSAGQLLALLQRHGLGSDVIETANEDETRVLRR